MARRAGQRRPGQAHGLPATAQHISRGVLLGEPQSQSRLGEGSVEPEDAEPGWAEGHGAPGRAAVCAGWGCRGARGGSGTPPPSARREAPAGSASTCYRTAFPLSINIDLPSRRCAPPPSQSPTLPPWFPLLSPSAPPPPSPGKASRLPGFSRCCLSPAFSTAV